VVVSEGDDSTDFGAAARVYWTLKAAGVRNLAILNGGLTAWRDAGLPLTTEVPRIARSSFDFTLDTKLIATRADVRRAVEAKNAVLLDARPKPYFDGQTKHDAATAPGTIAGAVDLDNAIWFAGGSSTIDDPAAIRRIAQQQGVDLVRPTVSFCNTGHWAATNWFVLSEILGHPDVKMYPESMVEWSRAGGAMDNVPGRLQQFAQQLKQAVYAK
jgi:thiosulfate/3-mercaptopyruvate sulfurtransferase